MAFFLFLLLFVLSPPPLLPGEEGGRFWLGQDRRKVERSEMMAGEKGRSGQKLLVRTGPEENGVERRWHGGEKYGERDMRALC